MKVGDLVEIRDRDKENPMGVITWVDMRYPPQCGILVDGEVIREDARVVGVINE